MLGWFKKNRKHEIAISVMDDNKLQTLVRVGTASADVALGVVHAVMNTRPGIIEAGTVSTSEDVEYHDPNYAMWDKATEEMEELREELRNLWGLVQEDQRQRAQMETQEAKLAETQEAKLAEKQRKEVETAKKEIGPPPTGGSSVRTPETTVTVKIEAPETTPRPKTLPLLGSTEGAGSNVGERIPAEKLAALAQIAAAAAPADDAARTWPTSKVEENGTITFRTKVDCPQCGTHSTRYRSLSNTYVKCRSCETKLLMEPATAENVYDGRVNQEVPAPDADGYIFHATRRF